MPSAATQRDLEISTLSQARKRRQVPYGITCMWSPQYDPNAPAYTTETESWTQRTELRLPRGRAGGGLDVEGGIRRRKLLYTRWINNKVLLHSTQNYIQYPGMNHNRKECKNVCVCIYIYMNKCLLSPLLKNLC